jgi:hypothetical protein
LKKIASILLLGILLFNLLGYRFIYSFLENAANQGVELKLDHDLYDESELISIRVPLDHLPYYSNSNQYDPVDGKMELNGIQYHFVKQKVSHDSLELLCIPDREATALQSAKNDFFKLVNDLERAGQGKTSGSSHGSSKNFSIDYFLLESLAFPPAVLSQSKKTRSNYDQSISSSYFFERELPPKSC